MLSDMFESEIGKATLKPKYKRDSISFRVCFMQPFLRLKSSQDIAHYTLQCNSLVLEMEICIRKNNNKKPVQITFAFYATFFLDVTIEELLFVLHQVYPMRALECLANNHKVVTGNCQSLQDGIQYTYIAESYLNFVNFSHKDTARISVQNKMVFFDHKRLKRGGERGGGVSCRLKVAVGWRQERRKTKKDEDKNLRKVSKSP